MDAFMKAFMDETVYFEMPENWKSWKQNTETKIDGNLCSKTVKRIVLFPDGSTKVLTVTKTKIFE